MSRLANLRLLELSSDVFNVDCWLCEAGVIDLFRSEISDMLSYKFLALASRFSLS